MPGLLAASGEYVPSITRAGADAFDFTFNQAPTTVTPSDFLLYTAQNGQIAGSAATVSGQVVRSRSRLPSKADVVLGAVLQGAVTVNGVQNSVVSEPIGPKAGFFTGTAANRGIGFTPDRAVDPVFAGDDPGGRLRVRAIIPRLACRARSRRTSGRPGSRGSTAI